MNIATPLWFILALGIGSMLIKAAGPVALGGQRLPHPLSQTLALAGPVLLATLAAVLTFADGSNLVVDARAGGLAIACVGLILRLPLLATVVAAATATALLRATGVGA